MKRTVFLLILFFSLSAVGFAQRDSTDLTGHWVAKVTTGNEMTFYKNGYLKMMLDGKIRGGNPALDPKAEEFARYKVTRGPTYFHIDLIGGPIENKKEVVQITRLGIFMYLSDGRLKLKVNPNEGGERPTKFVRDDPNTIIFTKEN